MRSTLRRTLVIEVCLSLLVGCGLSGVPDAGGDGDPVGPDWSYDHDYVCPVLVRNATDYTYGRYTWGGSPGQAGVLDPFLGPGETREIVVEGTTRCILDEPCHWSFSLRFFEVATDRPSALYTLSVDAPCAMSSVEITRTWGTHECLVAFLNDTDVSFDRCHWVAHEWGNPRVTRELDPPLGPGEERSLIVYRETFVDGPDGTLGPTDTRLVFWVHEALGEGMGWADVVLSPCEPSPVSIYRVP